MEKLNLEKASCNSERRGYIYYEDDEIDLYELFLKIKKRWKVILLSIIFFFSLALIYILIVTPTYRTNFAITPPQIDKEKEEFKQLSIVLINKLNEYLKNENYSQVAKFLNIKANEAEHIKKFYVSNSKRDKTSLVKVSIDLTNKEEIPQISNGIIYYLNNNKYIKNKINLIRKNLSDYIKIAEKKLQDLQNMKYYILENLKSNNLKALVFNPAEVDMSIIKLKQSILNAKKQLKMLKGYEIASQPIIPNKPVKPKKLLVVAISLISGLFIGIFLALFLSWLEEMKKKVQEKKIVHLLESIEERPKEEDIKKTIYQ